ncbi:hemophore-related protein [Tsukamurella asaccharolytica]|uniref:Hemophore-related protein n=1 Tax=Tsukamurella asaccharolytica TaxID=2592067 RepID=A0A5C5R7B6_9ACTN|nr:hemophore-related protein [Tsukamurella asaccharolytica]TWS18566.1 hemophore-related protein [Tsukamurella asaccharolytica]
MLNRWKFAATAGVAGALALAPAAMAQAAPSDPVPGTNCTVGQVERALVAVAPEAATAINQVPGGRAEAERILTLPPAERNARIHELGRQNPQLVMYYNQNQGKINQTIGVVAKTCSQY